MELQTGEQPRSELGVTELHIKARYQLAHESAAKEDLGWMPP